VTDLPTGKNINQKNPKTKKKKQKNKQNYNNLIKTELNLKKTKEIRVPISLSTCRQPETGIQRKRHLLRSTHQTF
jgi:hypothetical protein